MNWQLRADSNWSSSRARQWVVACIVSKRSVRVTTESEDTMTQLRGAYLMFEFIRQLPSEGKGTPQAIRVFTLLRPVQRMATL